MDYFQTAACSPLATGHSPLAQGAPLFLEGVIVCWQFDDFLEETLGKNLGHFDDLVVVTSHDDRRTPEVCRRHSVHCVATDVLDGSWDARFNKGAAINIGLANLSHRGWLLHLDADIVLPDCFRTMLAKEPLDAECLYGADRLNVVGWEAWQNLKGHDACRRQFQYRCLVQNSGHPLGARLVHREYGYCPIGYFQLWHASTGRRYPHNSGSAEHSDVAFALQWPLSCRRLLPGVLCYHLASQLAAMGADWQGRQTKRFGGSEQ
jgi:hypothetical protein